MTGWDALIERGIARPDVDVSALTTYRLGGPARFVTEPESLDELGTVIGEARRRSMPLLIVGRGSNLVVSDDGYDGIVVHLAGSFRDVVIADDGIVTAGAAVALPQLARATVTAGWGGLEFYVGIPGSVGGAVTMNAGFWGSETSDVLLDADLIDLASGEVTRHTNDDLAFSYRRSAVSAGSCVVSARYALREADVTESQEHMRTVTRWRKDNQPGGTHNAGSVFKNPEGDHAGRIIDELGLKGFRVGDVAVSDRHANFFVAGDDATALDVYNLVAAVQESVLAATGVELEPEIRFAGRFEAVSPNEATS